MKMKLKLKLKLITVLLSMTIFHGSLSFAQSLNVPTIDNSLSSFNFGVNPVLTQASSFGQVNCAHYNAFSNRSFFEFGLAPTNNCQILLNNNPIGQVGNVFNGQLGEQEVAPEELQEVLEQSDPQVRRNPYAYTGSYVNNVLGGPTSQSCPAGYRDEDSYPAVNLDVSLTSEERERLLGDLEDQPNWDPVGRQGALVELPSTGNNIADQEAAGYYRYNDGDRHVYTTDRVAWNIRAAGKILADNNIVMGVGELSARNGATPGHTEHQGGRDVDLRLIGPRDDQGVARASPCTVHNSGCYDRENTFEMVKAFIDVDPFGIDKVFINDPTLQNMINNYMEEAYGISRVNGSSVARSCAGHDNHIHLSFKNSGTNPDEMARRAQ